MSDTPGRPRFGSEEWRQERAELRASRPARKALLDSLRCQHGALPGRCQRCVPIDVDRIPF